MITSLFMRLEHEGRRHNHVAHEAGLHPITFSRIVRGWRQPTADEARRIAEVLGCQVAELFADVGPTEGASSRTGQSVESAVARDVPSAA